jgi:cell division protein FtsI (penicillin-binding protein 3)
MDFSREGRPFYCSLQIKLVEYITSWMAFGYGVSVTPMQTLAFYNAVANNGVMEPRLFQKLRME